MVIQDTQQFHSGFYERYFVQYLAEKARQNNKYRLIMLVFVIALLVALFGFTKPLFAKTDTGQIIVNDTGQEEIYLDKNFRENIKNKYSGSYITFPRPGIAHIKQIKYINQKPIRINIVELNTRVNQNLKIQPQTASSKLNSKATVRRIAQSNNSVVAINGGFFKPQNGLPLGALMINKEILTGPIFNRSAMAIFEENGKTYFKIMNVSFDIKGYMKSGVVNIDNINQPRMLSTYKLLYNSLWGEYSPVAPENCYNILIHNNKVTNISANPIKITGSDMVLQGPKEQMRQIYKNGEIYIDIKLPQELKDAKHIIGAGPFLVKDSQVYVDVKTQKLAAIQGKNPRSAIGFKNDGTLIIVTIDGREKQSVGMTLFEEANLMKKLGCEYAMNFDGGSSSALFVDGKIVNSAVNKEGIAVSNALVVWEDNLNELKISSAN